MTFRISNRRKESPPRRGDTMTGQRGVARRCGVGQVAGRRRHAILAGLATVALLAALLPQPAQAQTTNSAVSERPDRPQNLRSEPALNSVILSWDDPGDESITKYQMRQRRHGKRWIQWRDIPLSSASTTTYTVILPVKFTPRGEVDSRGYDFHIRAVNDAGHSRRSVTVADLPLRDTSKSTATDETQVPTTTVAPTTTTTTVAPTTTTTTTTVAPSKPGAPKNIQAVPEGDTVVVSWDDPGDDSITKYQMRQRRTGRRWGQWTDISVVTDNAIARIRHTVTGYVIRYTPHGEIDRRWHQIELRAVNDMGKSPVAFTFAPPRVS